MLGAHRLQMGTKTHLSHLLYWYGRKPVKHEWELPDNIVEKKAGKPWKHHLYCNEEGLFYAVLNGWEEAILSDEMRKDGLVGWLRNFPRRDWAFCIPYELGGAKPFYPDFIIVRKSAKGLLNKQVAGELSTTEATIKFHHAHIMQKMRANSLADLIRMVEKLGSSRQR